MVTKFTTMWPTAGKDNEGDRGVCYVDAVLEVGMDNKASVALDIRALSTRTLSPGRYVAMTRADKATVKSTEIVAPKLGDVHFGRIRVRYNTPIYEVAGWAPTRA